MGPSGQKPSNFIGMILIRAKNPRMDTIKIDLDKCGQMVLDALLHIKNTI